MNKCIVLLLLLPIHASRYVVADDTYYPRQSEEASVSQGGAESAFSKIKRACVSTRLTVSVLLYAIMNVNSRFPLNST